MEYTWVGKNRSQATKFFGVIFMGYESYLALKRRVKNFFSFVDTSVAGKLHFRYKMHVETYTHDLVFTKIIMTCLQQSSASFRVMSCLNKIMSSSTFVSLYCHLKIDVFETRTNKTYRHVFLKTKSLVQTAKDYKRCNKTLCSAVCPLVCDK